MRLPVGRLRVWAGGSGGHPPKFAAPVEDGPGLATQIHLADCGSSSALLVVCEFALTDPAQEFLDTAGWSPREPASAGTSRRLASWDIRSTFVLRPARIRGT